MEIINEELAYTGDSGLNTLHLLGYKKKRNDINDGEIRVYHGKNLDKLYL